MLHLSLPWGDCTACSDLDSVRMCSVGPTLSRKRLGRAHALRKHCRSGPPSGADPGEGGWPVVIVGRALSPAQSDSGDAPSEVKSPVAGRSDRAWATDSIRRRVGRSTPRDGTRDVVRVPWSDDGRPRRNEVGPVGPAPLGERRERSRRSLLERGPGRTCAGPPARDTRRRGQARVVGRVLPKMCGFGPVGETYTGPVGVSAVGQSVPLDSTKVSDTSTDCASDRTYFRKPPRSASPSARLSRSASNRNVPSSAVSISKNTL